MSRTSGALDGALAYLSGSMEYAADYGVNWRRRFIALAREAGLPIDTIDPTDKPGGEEMKIGENMEYQQQLQRRGLWVALRNYVHRYRRFDLRFVDISDFLVVAIDPRIPQWGTANEVYFAEQQHKPMFFIIDGGLPKLPRWLFDVVDLDDPMSGTHCNVFETVEQVIAELTYLNKGELPLGDKWVLVRREIERRRQRQPADVKTQTLSSSEDVPALASAG